MLFNRFPWSGNRYMQEQPHDIEEQSIHRHTYECRPFDDGNPLSSQWCTGYNTLKRVKEETGQVKEGLCEWVRRIWSQELQAKTQQEQRLQGEEEPVTVVHGIGDAL